MSDDDLETLLASAAPVARGADLKAIPINGDDEDELGLIAPPASSAIRHQLYVKDQQIKQDISSKKEAIKEEKVFLRTVRAQIHNELNDNGLSTIQDNSGTIDKLITESTDVTSYNRSFYFLNEVKKNEVEPGITLDHLDVDQVISSSDKSYLRYMDKVIMSKPPQKLSINWDHLGIIQSQLDRPQVKLVHYNSDPGMNILRISLFIKAAIAFDHEIPHKQIYKIFFLTLCDANAVVNCYSQLTALASLFEQLHEKYPIDVAEFLGSLLQVDVYNQELPILRYQYELHYHILHMLVSTLPENKVILLEIRAFLNYQSLLKYVSGLRSITKIHPHKLFLSISDLNSAYRAHYGLRLLSYIVDYDFEPDTLKIVVNKFDNLRSQYHKLVGDITFTKFEDRHNQKSQILQVLREDGFYLSYFHLKFSKYLTFLTNDSFYD